MTLSKHLGLALALSSTAACGAGELSICDEEIDTDSDGLSDCLETELGTAKHLADTDGDGMSDYQEVVEFGFSPDNNNFKFNPRISDTPHIRVEVTSAPSIGLLYESSTGVELSHSVERSQSSTQGVTTSQSNTDSQAIESTETVGGSVTVGTEAGFPGGVSASAEATVSYESSTTTTSETSVTWSEEQSQENAVGSSEAQALAASEGTTIHGGSLGVTVDVINDGDIAFTLSNLAISAHMTTPGLEQIISPVGALSFDTTLSTFPEFTIAPGSSNGPFIFANAGLDTGTAQALLEDSSNLTVGVVAYELTDENGRSFTHSMTDINAKTASVIIDYGDPALGGSERYRVATNTDADSLTINAGTALSEILRVPYEVDAKGALRVVRAAESNDSRNAYWLVVHKTTDGIDDSIQMHSLAADDYDFDSVELKSGDVLHLVYREDQDGDGLGYRQETAYGTDVDNADTDGDGIEDGDEVNGTKTSPTNNDSDADCLSDYDELYHSNTLPTEADAGVCESTSESVEVELFKRSSSYTSMKINDEATNVYYASPGEDITVSADWAVQTPSATYCSGCRIQYYLGMADVFSSCLGSGQHPVDSYISGTLAPTAFQAPTEPGVYYITQQGSLQNSCVDVNHSSNPADAVATIVVMDQA
jgi:hypothetical protein